MPFKLNRLGRVQGVRHKVCCLFFIMAVNYTTGTTALTGGPGINA
jgi:hypothetical protein